MGDWDVVVVGAGPAGAMAAKFLAAGGLRVLVLEKRRLPRYKACGGGLSAKVTGFLSTTGWQGWQKTVQDVTKRVVLTFRGMDGVEVSFADPLIHMVMRDSFDQSLVEWSRQAGAELWEGFEVKAVQEMDGGVAVGDGKTTVTAGFLVAADGATSRVARHLGMTGHRRLGMALEAELMVDRPTLQRYQGAVWLNHGNGNWGYDWIFPKGGHLSAGTGTFRHKARVVMQGINDYLDQLGVRAECLLHRKAHPIPTLVQDHPILHSRRCLLVGDAAGLVDPFCGEGIFYALQSGIIAAETILRQPKAGEPDLGNYSWRIGRELLPEFKYASLVAKLVFGLPRLMHRLVQKKPEIMQMVASVVFGSHSYRELYTFLAGQHWALRRLVR